MLSLVGFGQVKIDDTFQEQTVSERGLTEQTKVAGKI